MRRVAGALLCALVVGIAAPAAVAPPATAADSRAVVVIDTGQGSRRAVISFSGTITGIQALQLAGANPVTYGFAGQGAAVCALDGVGHPATDACLGTPSDPRYWAYFRAVDGANSWSYSNQCACSTTVRDGDVEGWRFGTGQQPPFVSFCDAAGCAPTPTPPPTAAPTPAPAPQPGGGGGGSATGGGGAAVPGAAVVPNPNDAGTSVNGDPPAATTSPTTSPAAAGRTGSGSDGTRESAAGLPRVRDDGGGSPWGVIVAVVVVAMLGLLAVVVRRRRSTA
jgi:hypothetical protein